MFSTFTGNSRRARNVNLSGQAGNPFSNTSWSPGAVSSSTKVVSNAQAEREKRQAERHRTKSAANIQRVWRGHRARRDVAEDRRNTFDRLYSSGIDATKRGLVLQLLPLFYNPRRSDDIQRLQTLVHDATDNGVAGLAPGVTEARTVVRLQRTLCVSLKPIIARQSSSREPCVVFDLLLRIAHDFPQPEILGSLTSGYYTSLADLYAKFADEPGSERMISYLGGPLRFASHGREVDLYQSMAFDLLSRDLPLLQRHMRIVRDTVNVRTLSASILRADEHGGRQPTKDQSLWILAHLIDIGHASLGTVNEYLVALYSHLSMLSGEIRARFAPKEKADPSGEASQDVRPLEVYVSQQLASLVKDDRLAEIVNDFSVTLADGGLVLDVSLLAGLIQALMLCFPTQADDIRMRLFLTSAQDGKLPVVRLLWVSMRETKLGQSLMGAPEDLVQIFGCYLRGQSSGDVGEKEWRLFLLFLELYTFILRISDDEDFLRGLKADSRHDSANPSMLHRLRETNLSRADLEPLTIALRNSSFALHYYRQNILDEAMADKSVTGSVPSLGSSMRPDFESLKSVLSTALNMLYERDARLHFLPANHWLMTGTRLNDVEFINAAVSEEQAYWNHAETFDSEDDSDDDMEDGAASRRNRSTGHGGPRQRGYRSRQTASMAPKLEVLRHMPFVIPFHSRVKLFRSFIGIEREFMEPDGWMVSHHARHHANIRRGRVFEDAYQQFFKIGDGLKDRIHISFYDQFDTQEAGIDGGGVTKEFLTSVITEALGDQELGLFAASESGLVYPNPTAIDCLRTEMRREGLLENSPEWNERITDLLKRFEFLGRIFGKCMYEGILVDVTFAGFFLLKWPAVNRKEVNNYKGSVNDLRDLDEELYKGLLQLKNHEGNLSQLGIDFTIVDSASRPGEPSVTITRELMKNGEQTIVTNDNRLLYNSYVARHRLIRQPYLQTQAFLRGLRQIIQPHWLAMFNQTELQRLVGGDSSAIDVDDLRRNTEYSGLYAVGDDGEEHPTIKLFWSVFESFTDTQKRDTLKYVTSTPRAPLLGFSQLNPRFAIRDSGSDETRLPSTSTCVNLLKLPRYTTEATLREKLLYAVESGAGFDLS